MKMADEHEEHTRAKALRLRGWLSNSCGHSARLLEGLDACFVSLKLEPTAGHLCVLGCC